MNIVGIIYIDIITNGFRALHRAAYLGHTAIVKTLIEAGADVDFRADVGSFARGETPLYLAAANGATLTVIELLKAEVPPCDRFP